MESFIKAIKTNSRRDRNSFHLGTAWRIGRVAVPIFLAAQVVLLVATNAPWQRTVLNGVATLVADLLGLGGMLYGAYWTARLAPRSKWGWRLMATAVLCTLIGDSALFIYQSVQQEVPWLFITHLFFLTTYPLFLIGTLLVPADRISRRDLARLGLDTAIIVLSSTLILWNLTIGPALAAGPANFNDLAVAVAYPTGDLILIWAGILLVFRPFTAQPKRPLWLVLAAGTLIIAGDLATALLQAANSSLQDWLVFFYLVAPLLLMLSGILQAIQVSSPKQPEAAPPHLWPSTIVQGIRVGLPYAWLGGAYLTLAMEPYAQGTLGHDLLFGWGGVIIGLVILRQLAAISENQQLTEAFAQLNKELEKRVAARTKALTRANDELRREMTERERVEYVLREREEKLAHNALHDALTGLPNRLLLSEHLGQAIRRSQRQTNYHFAILFLDLDGFKDVNDIQGHLAGDQVLVEIAGRLRATVREIDTVARLGGDEFVILIEDAGGNDEACLVAERIQAMLAQSIEIANQRIFLSASIGVVVGEVGYQQPDDILRDADLAMYEAKAQGKACSVLFTPDLRKHALERLELERDLRAALERREFSLHYQPILALDTNQYTGFEALIRWPHPERGNIPPVEFIPLAETSGLIVPITGWVLLEACRQMRTWQIEIPNYSELSISVNLSSKLFSQPELPVMVDEALAKSGLRPEYLRLEITESIIIKEADNTKKILNGWRQKGIQVHMDDFGTGYSSLSYLHQFPIDTLKIDRSFISLIQSRSDQSEIVRTIIALARELNIQVVAEGVETAEQLEFLRSMGCQSVQGYFISRPLTPEAAYALLTSSDPV